jgi:hypothetical protein
MSESLPENSFSGVLRVVKLLTGEEIVGLANEETPGKITIKLPAKLESYFEKDQNDIVVEYVRLTNYAGNLKGFEVTISESAIIFIGHPSLELEKMYEIYFMTMQKDPKSIISSLPEGTANVESGLQLLNDLFTNEDFVNFVNDLMDTYEGVEILADFGDEDDDIEPEPEASISPPVEEEPEAKPKKKKRRTIKPEGNKMPYKPDKPVTDPQSWSDDPKDYM